MFQAIKQESRIAKCRRTADPLKYKGLIVSDTDSIDEHTEYRNSARGLMIALEEISSRESYLDEMIQGTTVKYFAYGTIVSSEMHPKTDD